LIKIERKIRKVKPYLFGMIATFCLVATNSDVVFNPYLFDIETINAYHNMFDGGTKGI
jgi:hypothetical protein